MEDEDGSTKYSYIDEEGKAQEISYDNSTA
jgi:hypothetical protein